MVNPESLIDAKQERWPTTTSSALLLSNQKPWSHNGELVLVCQRKNDQWGLIAGNLEKGENCEQAVWRELQEETGLDSSRVVIQQTNLPRVFTIPGDTKTSIGLVYRSYMLTPIPRGGYEPKSSEVALVKPFSVEEIRELVAKPETVYKPDFNLFMLHYWLWQYYSLKYAFEGGEFAELVARSRGVDERVFKY